MSFSTPLVKIISYEEKRQLSCFLHLLFSSISFLCCCYRMELDLCFSFYILQRTGFIHSLQMLRPWSQETSRRTALMEYDTYVASGTQLHFIVLRPKRLWGKYLLHFCFFILMHLRASSYFKIKISLKTMQKYLQEENESISNWRGRL